MWANAYLYQCRSNKCLLIRSSFKWCKGRFRRFEFVPVTSKSRILIYPLTKYYYSMSRWHSSFFKNKTQVASSRARDWQIIQNGVQTPCALISIWKEGIDLAICQLGNIATRAKRRVRNPFWGPKAYCQLCKTKNLHFQGSTVFHPPQKCTFACCTFTF